MESRSETIKTIAELSGIRAHTLYRDYKKTSEFHSWDQRSHASEYLVFAGNIGKRLSIDEVSLSKGELYTYVTNKAAKGRKGSLVASIQGTRSEDIIRVLEKIPLCERIQVEEVTLDMAPNMAKAITRAFPNARQVTDHFHVAQLVYDAMQHVRIKLRWEELDRENKAAKAARKAGRRYVPEQLVNGDSPRRLLARSRYPLYKPEHKWTKNQWLRLYVAFERYPELKTAYDHVQWLVRIYRMQDKHKATEALNQWIKASGKLKIKEFASCANTIREYFPSIINYFDNRSTNASAESFNAKIKQFRASQRGVKDTEFFLFRLTKLYA